MGLENLVVKEEGAHPDHGEKGSDRAKDGDYGTRGVSEVEGIYCRIQSGDNLSAALL